jgi:hypothetical protein
MLNRSGHAELSSSVSPIDLIATAIVPQRSLLALTKNALSVFRKRTGCELPMKPGMPPWSARNTARPRRRLLERPRGCVGRIITKPIVPIELESQRYGRLRSSEDFREGVEAFGAKRNLSFRGR